MGKHVIVSLSVVFLFWNGAVLAEQAQPYIPRSESRPPEESVNQLVDSPNAYKFYLELKENCDMGLGHLTEAAEQGKLVLKKCGDCTFETAALFYGRSVYWRLVQPSEDIVYVHGCPAFLNACGNPVRDVNHQLGSKQKVSRTSDAQAVQQPVALPPVTKEPYFPREGCRHGAVYFKHDGINIPGVFVGYGPSGMYPWYFDSGDVVWTTSVHPVTCVYNISPPNNSSKLIEKE